VKKCGGREKPQSLRDNKCYNRYLIESNEMTISMCQDCSINTNREEWAKYPDMIDLCKMCESFQASINEVIDKQAVKLKIGSDLSKKLKGRSHGNPR
jgi:hypothetical protein